MADNIYSKLLAVQTALKAPKSQYNSYGKYNYRTCEDILEAVKPHLLNSGLTLTLTDAIASAGDRIYVVADATISDGESSISSQAYAREPEDQKGMQPAQITGASSSYARKYALSGLFLLDDSRDADYDKAPQNATNDLQIEIKDLRLEVTACKSIKELEAHYKANEQFVKQHNLIDLYAKKRKQLS